MKHADREIDEGLFPGWRPRALPTWLAKARGEGAFLLQQRAALRPGLMADLDKDGLAHLAPFCLYLDADPAGCRRMIGKGLWKQVHHGSLATNKNRVFLHLRKKLPWPDVFRVAPINLGTVVRSSAPVTERVMFAAIHGRPTGIPFREVLIFIRDAEALGVTVDLKWSLKRLIKEHDRAVNARERDRAAAELARNPEPFAEPFSFSADGFTAERICTPGDLALEGKTMRHCVDSYVHYCRRGEYAVFRISGAARATLGLHLEGRLSSDLRRVRVAGIEQVKGRCNARVSKETRAFANLVRAAFNESLNNEARR